METQANRYYLDGADMWLTYGLGVESGSDDFLKLPKRKESITRNWLDENGIDVDTSRVFLEAKEIELQCHIIAANEADFWQKYNRLLAVLSLPGQRRMTVAEFGQDFFLIYQSCSVYKRFTRLKQASVVACKLTLKFLEMFPVNNPQLYIVDEENRFIVT